MRASGQMTVASPTTLLTEIGELWGAKSLGEIVEMANARPGPDLAALAPIVTRCAEAGDELAIAVLERAGAELAEQVALVAVKMKESGGGRRKTEAAYTGGVLEHNSRVRSAMISALRKSAPAVKMKEGAVDALDGALWTARNAGLLMSPKLRLALGRVPEPLAPDRARPR